MALTTRVISWSVTGFANSTQNGTITVRANTPQLVDTVGNVIYVQDTQTYSIAAGLTSPLICTDNASTNPSAGSWGYTITIVLQPGIPSITVQSALLPTGGGNYSLASILNLAGL